MKYLTKREVADLLRVSIRTISEYRSRGLLPAPKRLGRRLLWDENELIGAVSLFTSEVQLKVASVPKHVARGRPRKVAFK